MTDTPRLLAFVVLLVGGILAVASPLRAVLRGFGLPDTSAALLLLGGILGLAGAFRGWKGSPRDGGVLGVVGGALVLFAGSDLAGALLLAGAVIYLVR